MKRSTFSALCVIVLTATVLLGTSCNRGVGCPNNMNAGDIMIEAAVDAVDAALLP